MSHICYPLKLQLIHLLLLTLHVRELTIYCLTELIECLVWTVKRCEGASQSVEKNLPSLNAISAVKYSIGLAVETPSSQMVFSPLVPKSHGYLR